MKRVTTDEAIKAAVTTPPQNTRALGRSQVIRRLMDSKNKRYVIDWDSIYVDRERFMDLRNPFHSYEREAAKFAAKLYGGCGTPNTERSGSGRAPLQPLAGRLRALLHLSHN